MLVSEISIDVSQSIEGSVIGLPHSLICTVTVVVGVSPSLVKIDWTGNSSLSESPRVTIFDQTITRSHDRLILERIVIFSPLLDLDIGEYTCSVMMTGFDGIGNFESAIVIANDKYQIIRYCNTIYLASIKTFHSKFTYICSLQYNICIPINSFMPLYYNFLDPTLTLNLSSPLLIGDSGEDAIELLCTAIVTEDVMSASYRFIWIKDDTPVDLSNDRIVVCANTYVTRHEKTGLMYTRNLITFLDFKLKITL